MKILLLGATGMLGSQFLHQSLQRRHNMHVIIRNDALLKSRFPTLPLDTIHLLPDIKEFTLLESLIATIKPGVMVNCVGIVKQSELAKNAYESVAVNSYLPHFLAQLAEKYNLHLIHISTDCVFDGKTGNYTETDFSDATDLYGKSKYLGEVGSSHAVTLRTSIIGHELTKPTFGLLEWFLATEGTAYGFAKAIFSGVTTNELSKIILDEVIPKKLTGGVFQVAATPISKYDLIKLIAKEYGKTTQIVPSDTFVIDRSLNGHKFRKATGYEVPSWPVMIQDMHKDFINSNLIYT
jgi:dTDP-4-dehydrorhamnose reductase